MRWQRSGDKKCSYCAKRKSLMSNVNVHTLSDNPWDNEKVLINEPWVAESLK